MGTAPLLCIPPGSTCDAAIEVVNLQDRVARCDGVVRAGKKLRWSLTNILTKSIDQIGFMHEKPLNRSHTNLGPPPKQRMKGSLLTAEDPIHPVFVRP